MPRRRFLVAAAGGVLIPLAPTRADATQEQVAALIQRLVGDAPLHEGKVKLDIPVLVENGNAVSMTVSVDAPLGTVRTLHVFAPGNPLPEVLHLRFGPRAGVPRLATRIRLADSQTVTAIAWLTDGSFWQDSVELLVTLAACIE